MTQIMPINGKNLRSQKYSLPHKLLKQLIKTADAETMQKLHRCCKQLYQRAPYFIVDSINCNFQRFENERYDACLIFFDENELNLFASAIDNIWITKKALLDMCEEELFDKIIRCDASDISTDNLQVSFETFEMFTKSGNVEYLQWYSVILPDGDEAPLEDILALVPNASSITHCGNHCYVTPQTMSKLNEIPWKQKITNFRLRGLDENIDAGVFYNFVKVRSELLCDNTFIGFRNTWIQMLL